jgi:hypothetical protein
MLKTKAIVQSRRLGKGRTLTIEDHKIEVVRRFKYLGTVMTSTMEQKKFELGSWQPVKPTAPCKPYSNLNKSIKTTR